MALSFYCFHYAPICIDVLLDVASNLCSITQLSFYRNLIVLMASIFSHPSQARKMLHLKTFPSVIVKNSNGYCFGGLKRQFEF